METTGNEIHETAIISPSVEIGLGNRIGAFTIITGNVTLGNGNWIGSHVNIGGPPEDRHSRATGQQSGRVNIGDNNFIYEFTAIQSPTVNETRIGSDCFIMDKSHIAHDCVVDDEVTISPGVVLGGHCFVGRGAQLGMGSCVHQRVPIGGLAMVGMQSSVTAPVPPFFLVAGQPARQHGMNVTGMSRANWIESSRDALRRAVLQSDGKKLAVAELEVIQRWSRFRDSYRTAKNLE